MIERLRQDKTFNWIGDLEIRESSSEREESWERSAAAAVHCTWVLRTRKRRYVWMCMWMCDALDIFLMYASVAVVRFNKESSARCVPVSAYLPVTSPCQYCQYTTLHSPVAIWANCTNLHNITQLGFLLLLNTAVNPNMIRWENITLFIYLIVKVKLRPNLTVI